MNTSVLAKDHMLAMLATRETHPEEFVHSTHAFRFIQS